MSSNKKVAFVLMVAVCWSSIIEAASHQPFRTADLVKLRGASAQPSMELISKAAVKLHMSESNQFMEILVFTVTQLIWVYSFVYAYELNYADMQGEIAGFLVAMLEGFYPAPTGHWNAVDAGTPFFPTVSAVDGTLFLAEVLGNGIVVIAAKRKFRVSKPVTCHFIDNSAA